MKTLITGAYGFLGKYVLNEIALRNAEAKSVAPDCAPLYEYKTLGLNAGNNIVADLIKKIPTGLPEAELVIHLAGSCRQENAGNINVATTQHLLTALDATPPRQLVYISSTEVYGREEGTDLTEGTITDPQSRLGKAKLLAEETIEKWCVDKGVTLTILRCPEIVGTGMMGNLRSMVNSIYRGTYHHIDDETQRLSIVHAVDVARAILDLAPKGGIYNMTDGVNPSRRELADALAYRLNDKRIYTIRHKRARITAKIFDFIPFASFGSDELAERYRSLTFSADKVIAALGWQPNSVTHYLRNHVYDENSL